MRPAQRCTIVDDGPDHRGRPHQPKQQPTQSQRDQPEHGDEHVSKYHRNRKHHEVDQERKHPPRQHAAKQFGLRPGIEGMRLIIGTAAAPGAAAGVTRTAVRHDPSSATVPSPRETWEWVWSAARAYPAVIPGRVEDANPES